MRPDIGDIQIEREANSAFLLAHHPDRGIVRSVQPFVGNGVANPTSGTKKLSGLNRHVFVEGLTLMCSCQFMKDSPLEEYPDVIPPSQRWPSAAARDLIRAEGKRLLEIQAIAPSAARPCYASARRWEFTRSSKDIIQRNRTELIRCGTLRSHQLVNMSRSISGSDKPSLLSCN